MRAPEQRRQFFPMLRDRLGAGEVSKQTSELRVREIDRAVGPGQLEATQQRTREFRQLQVVHACARANRTLPPSHSVHLACLAALNAGSVDQEGLSEMREVALRGGSKGGQDTERTSRASGSRGWNMGGHLMCEQAVGCGRGDRA